MYRLIVDSLAPYPMLLVAVGLALAMLWRRGERPRRWLTLLTVLYGILFLFCMPVLGYLALGSLEWRYPPSEGRPEGIEAIVVLTAGMRPPDTRRSAPELDLDSLLRCHHAADLYRQGPPCPVVVSGGKVTGKERGPACANVMADVLVRLGVRGEDMLIENRSSNTHENAVETSALLEKREIRTVALVVDAVDMARAEACFRKQGLQVVPCACHYRASELEYHVLDFLPHPSTAGSLERAGHEWLGLFWYWLHGRV